MQDEEREKRQFEMYVREVQKRFRNSKMKNYKFPKITEQSACKNAFEKSRNQEDVAQKFIRLTDLYDALRTQRTTSSGQFTASLDNSRQADVSTMSKKTFESK